VQVCYKTIQVLDEPEALATPKVQQLAASKEHPTAKAVNNHGCASG
jgi:hypothetical protein